MVRLTKIYTRTGDDGTTGLGDGSRTRKTDLRVASYGDVDEANSLLGFASAGAPESAGEMRNILSSIQNDLFDVGADLATPVVEGENAGDRLRITEGQTSRLEGIIDAHNERLSPLSSFVLPGGSEFASRLHLARAAVRRAERTAAALLERDRDAVNIESIRYLNRLSDLLFVLARVANDNGAADVLWRPGASRDADSGGSSHA